MRNNEQNVVRICLLAAKLGDLAHQHAASFTANIPINALILSPMLVVFAGHFLKRGHAFAQSTIGRRYGQTILGIRI